MSEEKLNELVRQYEKLVFTVCFQLVGDYHEAQNLTQETFLSAFRHLDAFRGTDYKPWLVRIAANKAKDYLKSAYVRRVTADLEASGESMTDRHAGPEDSYIRKELGNAISDAVQSLKEPYVKVASLYFLEERTPEEIAKILNRPIKTVQTQLYRSKIKLRDMLKEFAGKERKL